MNGDNLREDINKIYPVLKTDLLNEKLTESLIQKEINKINSFNNHIQNIKDMKDYFIYTTKHNKKMYKHYKHINVLINILESIVVIGTTSTSITLSIVGLAPIVIPIVAGGGISVTLINKILNEKLKKEEKKYLKMYTLTNITLEEFNRMYIKSLEDNIINENEYSKLCNIFNNYVNENQSNNIQQNNQQNNSGKSFLAGTGDL